MDIKHENICRCTEDDVTPGDVIYLNAREFSALTRIIGAIAGGLK